jgi:hypothetical protein
VLRLGDAHDDTSDPCPEIAARGSRKSEQPDHGEGERKPERLPRPHLLGGRPCRSRAIRCGGGPQPGALTRALAYRRGLGERHRRPNSRTLTGVRNTPPARDACRLRRSRHGSRSRNDELSALGLSHGHGLGPSFRTKRGRCGRQRGLNRCGSHLRDGGRLRRFDRRGGPAGLRNLRQRSYLVRLGRRCRGSFAHICGRHYCGPSRQKRQWIQVALRVPGRAYAEVHEGLRELGHAARPDRPDDGALGKGFAPLHRVGTEMDEGDCMTARRHDRDGLAPGRHRPGEFDDAIRRCPNGNARRRAEIHAAMLPAAVRVGTVEQKRPQHGALDGPGPRLGNRDGQCECAEK